MLHLHLGYTNNVERIMTFKLNENETIDKQGDQK